MKDETYSYNQSRWEALVKANALFTRPMLTLDPETAAKYLGLERLGLNRDLNGKKVLCLASGGGQQSAAFALLGAAVTVYDISASQLERDKAAAQHYGVDIELYQGDMRDLSQLYNNLFDIVWQPYSINFIPDARCVFHQLTHILDKGGIYYLMCANPFFAGVTHHTWNGDGYTIKYPYKDETITTYPDQDWVYDRSQGSETIQDPKEYTQTLSRILNGLIMEGFILSYFSEIKSDDPEASPGSWEHFTNIAPPWMEFVWRYALI